MQKSNFNKDELLKKAIVMMTGEELCFLIRSELQDMVPEPSETSSPHYYYGIAGIAKLLDCSEPTANRIKASGIIDGAITQVNRKIIVDGEKALALIRANGGRFTSSENRNA